MFPFTAACSSNIKQLIETDKTKAITFLKDYVEGCKGKNVALTGDEVSFEVDIFMPISDKFAGINKGTFILTSSKIIFKFQMYALFIALFIVATAIFFTHRYIDMITAMVVILAGNWMIYYFKFRKITNQLAEKINAGL